MTKVELFVAVVDGKPYVATRESCAAIGLDSGDMELLEAAGKWWTIPVRTATYDLQEEIKTLSLERDHETGFSLNESLLAKNRAALLIEKWPDWEWPDFGSLPAPIANILNAELLRVMYPGISGEDFISALRSKLQASSAQTTTQQV
jgi:hypothetical protein